MSSNPTNSGIITDDSGERHIPESTRPDGSVRKAIKIRPGYKPPEDAVLYKNRTAESFRNRYKGGVIGAEASATPDTSSASSAAANKNAKRREARKKAKESGGEKKDDDPSSKLATAPPQTDEKKAEEAVDPEVERKKKARNLTKKLKQAKELQDKKDGGQSLLPEQIAKVIKINELVRELAALGFDTEGEPMKQGEKAEETKNEVKEEAAPA
ncbi:hypothetical protein N0V93_003738 [Gnomoniopsis smithogilvyi]|uniref:WIBG Mago-binding domain-containing protein n=1 Tax=Gnomoniopsis smithogilvyi TaxID=1191159 RepID=A0A9W8Z1C3_9PEZI|nr:hypothetical protein N0V93_003738 [Gnomoniopsis smithogilvyi]